MTDDLLAEFDRQMVVNEDASIHCAGLLEEIAMAEAVLARLRDEAEKAKVVVDQSTAALDKLWKTKAVQESMIGPPNPDVFDD